MNAHRLIFLGLMLMSLVPWAASAGDGKNLPGIMCRPTGTTGEDLDDISWGSKGSIENLSTGTEGVVCPLIFDYGSKNQPTMIVQDESTTSNFSCTAYAKNVYGSTVSYSSVSSSGYGSGIQTLNFGTLARSGGDYGYIYCNVPGTDGGRTSAIYMYSFYEY